MRNQIPKDSAFLEGFQKLQSNYNLFEEKINQVYHQLHLIDEKFNRENNTDKENDAIYEGKYALFIFKIKKIIEEKKEKEEEPLPGEENGEMDIDKPPPGKENSDTTKYENLLKDLDKVLIKSVSVRANFNSIEEMKGTVPTNSAIFKGFNSLQSDYIQVEKNIDKLCNELKLIKKDFSRETYSNKEKSDDYEKKYAEYRTQMKELIEKENPSSSNENSDDDKHQNLLKDLNEVLTKSASVRAKFDAAESLKEKIPTDSAFLEEFNTLKSNHDLLEVKINKLCNELKLIDNDFNQETRINKEKPDDYEKRYFLYIADINKLIEEKKDKEEEPPPEDENGRKDKCDNLLKDFCNMLKEKATISANIEAIEHIKKKYQRAHTYWTNLKTF